MPGCDMLFTSSLSQFPSEFEIIIPTKAIILDGNGWNDSAVITAKYRELNHIFNTRALSNIKYNNRNNEYGIIGDYNDMLQTLDIVIIGNPP